MIDLTNIRNENFVKLNMRLSKLSNFEELKKKTRNFTYLPPNPISVTAKGNYYKAKQNTFTTKRRFGS